jgi:hypothetical protein
MRAHGAAYKRSVDLRDVISELEVRRLSAVMEG